MRSLQLTHITAIAICLTIGAMPAAANAQVEVKNCLVSGIDDVNVPAKESGVLVELPAKPGQRVKKEDLLGKIDDSRSRIDFNMAKIAYKEAEERASNDINVRYAVKEAEVAKSEFERAQIANQGVGGAISESELKTKELDAERAILQIEQAKVTQGLIKYEIQSASEQWTLAAKAVKRRQIVSPTEGEVFEVHRTRGEWVQAGDPVVRVVRMNQLQIVGFLKEADHARASVIDRLIEVQITVKDKRIEKFSGKIVFASSETTGGGEFRVTAEVDNRKKDDIWLLKPGQLATMTIK